MSPEFAAILATSAFQSTLQMTAIIMLYQQGRMLTDMHKTLLGAEQVAAASFRLDEVVKEVRELLRSRKD
jgi:hypothetical protein